MLYGIIDNIVIVLEHIVGIGAALFLVAPRSGCETIVLRLFLSFCLMTLKWHNIVNSQYIAMQLYMKVDIPQRYVGIEI